MRRLRTKNEDALRSELKSGAGGSIELRCAHRLHAVLLVSVGRSCYEVARWLGNDARSVERWVHAYTLLGADGLRDGPHGGRPARLTPPTARQLALELNAGPGSCGYPQPSWSGKLLARHVLHRYGIRLSVRHCQRLLKEAKQ